MSSHLRKSLIQNLQSLTFFFWLKCYILSLIELNVMKKALCFKPLAFSDEIDLFS